MNNSNFDEVIKILSKKVLDSESNKKLLLFACRYNRLDSIKYLIENNFNIAENFEEALYISCACHSKTIIECLLENGADPNIRNGILLTHASVSACYWLLNLLIDYGGNIHVNNGELLINACIHNHTEFIKKLIKKGIDINSSNDEALLVACSLGKLDIVTLLIENGTNIHDLAFKNAYKNYICSNCIDDRYLVIIDYLINKCEDKAEVLMLACYYDRKDIVKEILKCE